MVMVVVVIATSQYGPVKSVGHSHTIGGDAGVVMTVAGSKGGLCVSREDVMEGRYVVMTGVGRDAVRIELGAGLSDSGSSVGIKTGVDR